MNPPYAPLAQALEQARLRKGFASQKALADALRVTQQTVSRWIAGTHRPQLAQIAVLARVLDLNEADLRRLADYEAPAGIAAIRPLPVERLDPETFEMFTRDLVAELEPDAEVARLGKTGHDQGGFDVVAFRKRDGRLRQYQCKRVAQFGPAEVERAVKAGTEEAGEKVLVLSRVASPQTVRAMEAYPDWSLWDRDGINARFRTLSPNVQDRLVDTYFRGQELELLGRQRASAWLEPDAFFRPFLHAGGLFTHDWTLHGREAELADLKAAAADPANLFTLLSAAGGMGKSRLLREAADQLIAEGAGRIWFLSGAAEIARTDLANLGPGPKLLVVDDAHDREGLGVLFEYAATPENQARLLMATRPYAEARVTQEAAVTGLSPRVVRLAILSTRDLESLARTMLERLEAPQDWTDSVVAVAGGSPLIVAMAARILAEDPMAPERIRSRGELRDFILGKFAAVIAGRLGPDVDAAAHLKVLEIIALAQPFHPEDPQLLALIETTRGVPAAEAERAMRTLVEGGVVLRRGSHHRLMPDVLGDYLIDKACLTTSGDLSATARDVLEAASPRLLVNIFTNLGRLDWRRTDGQTDDSSLLDQVWRGLRDIDSEYDDRLDAVRAVALFQPRQALDFVAFLVRKRLALQIVPDILRNIALTPRYRRDALDLLWAVGRDDDRRMGAEPSHGVRVITELASFRQRKSPDLYDDILVFALEQADRPEAWGGAQTPVNLFSPFLATEAMEDRYDGRAFSFTRYGLNYEFVQPYRAAVLDKLFDLIRRPETRIARRAALAFSEALQGNGGERDKGEGPTPFETEFIATLHRLREVVAEGLPDAVAIAVVSAIDWHVDYGDVTREAAQAVMAALPDSLSFRLRAALADGFGNAFLNRRDAENWHDNLDAWMREIAGALRAAAPDPEVRRRLIEEAMADLTAAGDDLTGAHVLVQTALQGDLGLAEAFAADAEARPDSPTTRFAAIAAAELRAEDPKGLRDRLRRWAWSDREDLRRMAPLTLIGKLPAFGQADITLVRELLVHPDDAVVQHALRAVWSWRLDDDDRMIDLIFAARLESQEAIHQVAMMLGGVRSQLVARMTPAQVALFLDAVEPLPMIDDHWTNEVIADLSRLHPRETAAFFRRRVERSTASPFKFRVANYGPYVRAALQFAEGPDGEAVLHETWAWLTENWDRGFDFQHGATQLFEAMFLGHEDRLVEFLDPLIRSAGRSQLGLIARLLREAHHSFVFRQTDFVLRFLERCAEVDLELTKEAAIALYSAASTGSWSGMPGQPMPRDLDTLAKSEAVLARLSRLSPAWELYDWLRRMSVENIERSRREGEMMDEE